MPRPAEFRDARPVAVYDAAYGWSRDDDSFLSLVGEEGPARVVDLQRTLVAGGRLLLESSATLRFRSEEELRASLEDAGFVLEAIYGGWLRQPVGPGDDGEFLVAARR